MKRSKSIGGGSIGGGVSGRVIGSIGGIGSGIGRVIGSGIGVIGVIGVICVAAAIMLTACAPESAKGKRMELQGKAQGTYYSIIYYDKEGRDMKRSIDSLLDDFDMTASLWVAESQLRRVNENRDSIVGDYFATLLRHSIEMNSFTEGAFDCTVGKLVNAWGFGFSKREEMTDALIDSLRQYTGQQPTIDSIAEGRYIVRKPQAEMTFDFNAIAQGYATDLVSRFLEQHGIDNYLVDIGGEVYAKGSKPDGSEWKVGIERPAETKDSEPEVALSIVLKDCSVVTSGSYRKYYEKDGTRYSHTIDPRTGRPVEHTLLSVSVIDSCAWRADALATAFMVMGMERSLEFIAQHPDDSGTQAVCFIYDDKGTNRVHMTDGFKKLVASIR